MWYNFMPQLSCGTKFFLSLVPVYSYKFGFFDIPARWINLSDFSHRSANAQSVLIETGPLISTYLHLHCPSGNWEPDSPCVFEWTLVHCRAVEASVVGGQGCMWGLFAVLCRLPSFVGMSSSKPTKNALHAAFCHAVPSRFHSFGFPHTSFPAVDVGIAHTEHIAFSGAFVDPLSGCLSHRLLCISGRMWLCRWDRWHWQFRVCFHLFCQSGRRRRALV